LHNRPVYADTTTLRGFWYDGENGQKSDWIFGNMENIYQGNFINGYMASDENTECPTDTHDWMELWNKEWKTNSDVKVECYEKDDGEFQILIH